MELDLDVVVPPWNAITETCEVLSELKRKMVRGRHYNQAEDVECVIRFLGAWSVCAKASIPVARWVRIMEGLRGLPEPGNAADA